MCLFCCFFVFGVDKCLCTTFQSFIDAKYIYCYVSVSCCAGNVECVLFWSFRRVKYTFCECLVGRGEGGQSGGDDKVTLLL